MDAVHLFLRTATFVLAMLALSASCWASEVAARNGERLLAFIGNKVELTEQAHPACPDCMILDSHYVATYRILATVSGNYRGEQITFDVFDHYGKPAFSNYENVLLFVSAREDGTWVHEKYQFHALYQATDGQWYGCGDPYGTATATRTVHARPVQFLEPVSFPLDDMSNKEIQRKYPTGYFEIRNKRAYCVKGTSVTDLFQATKETVLKARGIFE